MNIVVLDDEPRALHMLEIILDQMEFEKDLHTFLKPAEALEYLKNNLVDVVFLDVEMPEINGIDFADKLLELPDPPAVVFVTGHHEYAYLAWDVEAIDYILKPYSRRQVQRAMERYRHKYQPLRGQKEEGRRIEIQCFPNFDVYVDGRPIVFRHKKSKELLAFLVHNRGAWVSMDKTIFALFEHCDEETAKNYYRGILYRLRRILMEAGIRELIETAYGKCRVDAARFTCDYYQHVEGEKDLFSGEYMSEYSWAEETAAQLQRDRWRSNPRK